MREWTDLLDQREKRLLFHLALATGLAFLFLIFVFFGQRGAILRLEEHYESRKVELEKLEKESEETKKDWLRWQQGLQDIAELKRSYFYERDEEFTTLRSDLQKIFQEAGIGFPELRFEYEEREKEEFKRVTVQFNMASSYVSLKKFLDYVEKFPKFLIIEKVDFLNIHPQSGNIELKIVLAGYCG